MDFQVKSFNHTQAREEGWDLVWPTGMRSGCFIWQYPQNTEEPLDVFQNSVRLARTFVLSRALAGYTYHIKALAICAVGDHLPTTYGDEYPFATSFLMALQIHAKAGGSAESFAAAVMAGNVR